MNNRGTIIKKMSNYAEEWDDDAILPKINMD
jgi:hypothetical protein